MSFFAEGVVNIKGDDDSPGNLQGYAAPAKFNGHVKMSAKDWENFNNSAACQNAFPVY